MHASDNPSTCRILKDKRRVVIQVLGVHCSELIVLMYEYARKGA
jgi:hypothetical protein